jgi:hypothetical protein
MAIACAALLGEPDRSQRGARQEAPAAFLTDVPAQKYDIILTRPARDTVTASILAYGALEGYVGYGDASNKYTCKTALQSFPSSQPVQLAITGLMPGTRYYYRFYTRPTGTTPFEASAEASFCTAKPQHTPFEFTVTADSHLDEHTLPDIYLATMRSAARDGPDFHIDLGDTFMTEKHVDRASAAKQYLAQRYYFSQVARSAPLFLVLGNHDGETVREQDGTANSLAVWSNAERKQYFPMPRPDAFYSGNDAVHALAGDLQDYYAWEWGDAQFIVLDPFWYTPRQRGGDDNWARTLGRAQYDWLRRTLEASHAKFKFVFIHHLVGGLGRDARGGSEAAPFFEWGGKNADGTDGFASHRSGWGKPIHQLMMDNHVAVVFHGHDHLFAKQDLDGIVYQEVPQPGWEGRFDEDRVKEYGYVKGTILPSSGYMRVSVADKIATVEYVRVESQRRGVGETKASVAYKYTIVAAELETLP